MACFAGIGNNVRCQVVGIQQDNEATDLLLGKFNPEDEEARSLCGSAVR